MNYSIVRLGACLLLLSASAVAKDPNKFSAEAKAIIAEADIPTALDKPGLKANTGGEKEMVGFFDTPDLALKKAGWILRARQPGEETGESTVKYRRAAGQTDGGGAGNFGEMEQDWTAADQHSTSNSLDNESLASGVVPNVLVATGSARGLFSDEQAKLIETAMGATVWDNLKHFGPAKARVWKKLVKLDGYADPVTVEIWNLQKDGARRVIFEISAKEKKMQSDADAQAFAQKFFTAVEAAKVGKVTGETKTAVVLGFYSPGR